MHSARGGRVSLLSVCLCEAFLPPPHPRISEVSQAPPPPGAHPQLMLSSFFPLSFCSYLNPYMNILMLLSLRESFSRVSFWQNGVTEHATVLISWYQIALQSCCTGYAFLSVPHETSCHLTPSITGAACGPAHGCSCYRVRFGLSFSHSY